MSSINATQVLHDALLERVLDLNPELAEDLTRLILEMEPEDVMAAISAEDEDLETLVFHLLEHFQRGSLPRQAHAVDSDDELVPLTPSGSDEEVPKDTKYRGGIHDSNTSASSSRTIQNQDPQVTDNAPRQGNNEGPAESPRAPASPASQKEVGIRVRRKTNRGSRGAAAGHSAVAVETGAPASMPLMEAVRPAEPARGDQQSARGAQPTRQGTTQQPANNGEQLDDKDLGFACLLGFCCGICFTGSWMLVHW